MAATEIILFAKISAQDISRADSLVDHAIETSKRIWRENPARPLLIKHAIRGLSLKAKLCAFLGKPRRARDAGQESIDLFETAWRPHIDQRWAISEAADVYEAWADVLITNHDYDAALEALDECEKLRDQYDQMFPIVAGSVGNKMMNDSRRIKVFTGLNDDEKRREVEDRMAQRVEASRELPGAIDIFRQLDLSVKFPASVSSLLELR